MHTEDLVVNDCSEGQVVEHFSAIAPNVNGAVLAQALVIKAVDLCDLTRLVISSNQGNTLRVSHLEGQQQEEGLYGVVASVDEVTHEEVVGIWALTTDLEELHQVVELSVDITADLVQQKWLS